MAWMMVVLLSKGGGNYCGIGLLEPFWETIEILMDRKLQVIGFHDCLHSFLKGATIEAKLAQQLAFLEQETLHSVFIYLKKAYDTMDREQCLEIFEGDGVGLNMIRLLENFWDVAMLVCRAVGVYDAAFQAHRGVAQGSPLAPLIFNIMVDVIVMEWLRQVLGAEAARHGCGKASRTLMAIFYADDAMLISRDPEQLQEALDIIVGLFERVGLWTNATKTKVMTSVTG